MLFNVMNQLILVLAIVMMVISVYLMIGRANIETLLSHPKVNYGYWKMFLELFTTMNGKNDFDKFVFPQGKVYMLSALFILKILFIALIAAIFVNSYRKQHKKLNSIKNFHILQYKNSSGYDSIYGAISLSFFPLNVILGPFFIPVIVLKSKLISDFVLKLEYVILMTFYVSFGAFFLLAVSPILYIKTIVNSAHILKKNKNEDFFG